MMALRKADILADRRKGRYVYYCMKNSSYLELLIATGEVCGLSEDVVFDLVNTQTYPSCECPHCAPTLIPGSSL